ncbi:Na+/H+ antiporter subunit G [Caryophanon tenue]|uniref:Na+/H+ antiporter subunit G n=1 Tax=Caryophanon tenue TaxID=33978 RepID=A0A1C0YHE1_9BACL|nr:Na+/H+ antiporter subunit G [Caryophanon tenue]OCS86612.1 Na+/H+ antiporter subunit G [Caryophanon tenue]
MSVSEMIEWMAVIMILVASIVAVLSAIGMIRLPDVYTRSHAATKSATLSVLMCLMGAFIHFWLTDGYISIRLLLGIMFVFITAPVAGHLICRAAYRSRVPLADESEEDELKTILFADEVEHLERDEVERARNANA